MKKSSTLILVAAALVALVWFLWPSESIVVMAEYDMKTHTVRSIPAESNSPGATHQSGNPSPPAPLEVSHLADQLNAPTSDIRADLKIVADVLANFRSNFPHDGNPVGNNAEITAVLTGQNKLRYAVIPPNHPAINQAGELCDRWGTPFFFHADSGTKMGIRSAGPDKKMWTDDDVVAGP